MRTSRIFSRVSRRHVADDSSRGLHERGGAGQEVSDHRGSRLGPAAGTVGVKKGGKDFLKVRWLRDVFSSPSKEPEFPEGLAEN